MNAEVNDYALLQESQKNETLLSKLSLDSSTDKKDHSKIYESEMTDSSETQIDDTLLIKKQ